MKLTPNIDGASLRNAGAIGLGVVLKDSEGKVLVEHFEHLGRGTNDRAGYLASLRSIRLAENPGGGEL